MSCWSQGEARWVPKLIYGLFQRRNNSNRRLKSRCSPLPTNVRSQNMIVHWLIIRKAIMRWSMSCEREKYATLLWKKSLQINMSNTTAPLPKTIHVETWTTTTKLDIKTGDKSTSPQLHYPNGETFGESSKMLMDQTLSSYFVRDKASLEQIVLFTTSTTKYMVIPLMDATDWISRSRSSYRKAICRST